MMSNPDTLPQVKILDRLVSDEEKTVLQANPDVVVWLGKVGYATRSGYVTGLCHFLKCVGIQNPTDLLDLKCREDLKRRYFPAERLVEEWIGLARQSKMSSAIIKRTVDAVRSFYKHNRVPLVQVTCPYKPKAKQSISDEDLRRFRGGFNWYGAILFDFLQSVPLRDGQFQRCPNCGQEFFPRWRDIDTFPRIEPYSAFTIRPQKGHENENYKEGLMQVCFLTASAAKALNVYRDHKQHALGRELRPDEYIFTHQKSHRGLRHIAPISKENIVWFFQQASERSGVHLSPHYLRTYANSVLASRGVEKLLRDLYLGHSCDCEQGYVVQLLPKWRDTLREVRALEHLDIMNAREKGDLDRDYVIAEQGKEIVRLTAELEAARRILAAKDGKRGGS